MFPTLPLIKDTMKAMLFIFFPNGLLLFLLVLQTVRFPFTLVETDLISNGSGNDPSCMGIVQSIQGHPWDSSHIVRHRDHLRTSLVCFGQQPECVCG